jgi:protein-S-isoprenylcysteine O-methyltransferase Ste14
LLRDEFRKSGEWLFRRRSYLPLLLIVLFPAAFADYRYPFDSSFGARVWELCCLGVSLVGEGVRVLTVGFAPAGTSGRNTLGQVAEVLNTTGAYSLVRHPLYLGNFLIWLGITLVPRVWWFSLLVTLIWWLYYERIMFAEEEFLQEKFGDAFRDWAGRTPALIPKLSNWRKPALPFSLKSVIRREYSTCFAIIAVYTALAGIGEIVVYGRPGIHRMWLVIFSISLVLYLAVRIIKKNTAWLHAAGR